MNESKELATTHAAPPQSLDLMTPTGLETALKFATTLVQSGLLPDTIRRPETALAIMLTGQELGIPPMRALRGIYVVKGRPSMSAELMLEHFRRRGGHVEWTCLTDTRAAATFTAPNTDTINGEFTMEMAAKAGYLSNEKYKKDPRAMLRSRCITTSLRSLGEAEGIYDPDELDDDTAPAPRATVAERVGTSVRSVVRPARGAASAESVVIPDEPPPPDDVQDADFRDASGPHGDDTGAGAPEPDTIESVRADIERVADELNTRGPGVARTWIAKVRPGGLATQAAVNTCTDLDTLILVRDEMARHAAAVRGGHTQ